jgi:hypothetical protein
LRSSPPISGEGAIQEQTVDCYQEPCTLDEQRRQVPESLDGLLHSDAERVATFGFGRGHSGRLTAIKPTRQTSRSARPAPAHRPRAVLPVVYITVSPAATPKVIAAEFAAPVRAPTAGSALMRTHINGPAQTCPAKMAEKLGFPR